MNHIIIYDISPDTYYLDEIAYKILFSSKGVLSFVQIDCYNLLQKGNV